MCSNVYADKSCCISQVLGDGELTAKNLTIKAAAFSGAAKEKIEAAGSSLVEVPQKPKWTRALHKAKLRAQGQAEAQKAK